MSYPNLLYSAAQVRALDAHAIAHGTPGYTLMKRAGEAALRALRSRWPTAVEIAVVAGGGNNGGDGYVLARFAQAAGLSARGAGADAAGAAARAMRAAPARTFVASGGQIDAASAPRSCSQADVIVDALARHRLDASRARGPVQRCDRMPSMPAAARYSRSICLRV